MNPLNSFDAILLGAIAMASLVAALFFLRFWHSTRDRFFLFFAASFFIESANRIVFWRAVEPEGEINVYYVLRLFSYLLILVAIIDKNRPAAK